VSGSASVALINSLLANNSAPDADAGAMLIAGNASVTVTACKFTGNHAGYNAAGIFAGDSSRLRVTSCTFIKNDVKNYAGGGIFAIWASVAVRNSSFVENHIGCSGGGISAGGSSQVTISNCTFECNLVRPVNRAAHALGGGGVVANHKARVLVEESSFEGSRVIGSSGGGISARHQSTVNVSTGTAFVSNNADVEGGAINIQGEAKLFVDGGVTSTTTPRSMLARKSAPVPVHRCCWGTPTSTPQAQASAGELPTVCAALRLQAVELAGPNTQATGSPPHGVLRAMSTEVGGGGGSGYHACISNVQLSILLMVYLSLIATVVAGQRRHVPLEKSRAHQVATASPARSTPTPWETAAPRAVPALKRCCLCRWGADLPVG
jgi:hypothetical protein